MLARLRFVHRHLWARDGLYRIAAVIGPAPLLGCGLVIGGALAWRAAHPPPPPPAWAVNPTPMGAQSSVPHEGPLRPLPAGEAALDSPPYVHGWDVDVHRVEMSPTMRSTLIPKKLATYTTTKAAMSMDEVVAAGPEVGQIVGMWTGVIAVRSGGRYQVRPMLTRLGIETATCLIHIQLGHSRLFELVLLGTTFGTRSPPPRLVELDPGLYLVGAVFGCWQDGHPVASARLTWEMARDDGEFRPLRDADLVRLTSLSDP